MIGFAVRLDIVKELFNDPEWQDIVVEYSKKHGWEIREVR